VTVDHYCDIVGAALVTAIVFAAICLIAIGLFMLIRTLIRGI